MVNNRVLLGFSGGIDSVKAVEVLRNKGYEVVALTIDTTDDQEFISWARHKAAELHLPIIVEDAKLLFSKKIIQYFTSEYNMGRTPAPCTVCNVEIKWRLLQEVAEREGCNFISTGHYFKIKELDGSLYVARADDPIKDQSYYLWGLTQDILRKAVTPMSSLIKSEIMRDLPINSLTKESMGVCFLRGESCSDYLNRECSESISKGIIVDSSGAIIGKHSGFQLYTIGQKRGVDTTIKGCVIGINSVSNQLIWGDNTQLNYHNLEIANYNIVNIDDLKRVITVKIRGYGNNPALPIKEASIARNRVCITLDDPAWAPALGQPVVLYCDDIVIGGGVLERYY